MNAVQRLIRILTVLLAAAALAAPARADVIVSFGSHDYLPGKVDFPFRTGAPVLTAGDLDGDGAADDSRATYPFADDGPGLQPAAAGYNATIVGGRFHGGFETTWYSVGGAGFERAHVEDGGVALNDSISTAVQPASDQPFDHRIVTAACVVWTREAFLSGALVHFDETSRLSMTVYRFDPIIAVRGSVRLVVRDGATYYVSKSNFVSAFADEVSTTIVRDGTTTPTLLAEQWAPYTPGSNLAFDAAKATFATHTFNDVRAVGYYWDIDITRSRNNLTRHWVSCTRFLAEGKDGGVLVDAGPDQHVLEGDTVTLDGRGTNPPPSPRTTYAWTQTAGPAVVLTGASGARPTFVAPETAHQAAEQSLSFRLDVACTLASGAVQTSSDTMTVFVKHRNEPPHANAGADQDVREGDMVTLDGTQSDDPDANDRASLRYEWSQIPGGPAVTLEDATSARPTFIAPPINGTPYTVRFKLRVIDPSPFDAADTDGDDLANPLEDGVAVHVRNRNEAPVCSIAEVSAVSEGDLVTLDGSASHDPTPNGPLTFAWSRVDSGSPVELVPDGAHATFTAPSVALDGSTLTFQLAVSDGQFTSTCLVNVHVVNVNHVPVANAGADQSVIEGAKVTIDGGASFDCDGADALTYTWRQVSGPTVALTTTGAGASFVAPEIPGGDAAAKLVLTFELRVTDGYAAQAACDGYALTSVTDLVTVTVENVNHPPIVSSTAAQTAQEGSAVTLIAPTVVDPDGDALTYTWTQISGPTVALVARETMTPTFVAPFVGAGGATLVFQLTISDAFGGSLTSTVSVSLVNVGDPPSLANAVLNAAALWPPNHKLVRMTVTGVAGGGLPTTVRITGVTQDEPVNGTGDGDTGPDAVIDADGLLLRAERSGGGDGRVYRVTVAATNAQGTATRVIKVGVPRDQKPKDPPAVEGTAVHDSTQG
jgi:hypothetical protein